MNRQKTERRVWRLWLVLVGLIVYLPVITVVALSFNDSRYGTLPFKFTFKWYELLFGDNTLLVGALRSLMLALVVAAAAGIIGTLTSIWLVRFAKRAAIPMTGLLTAAITIPWLILSVSILLLAVALGSGRSFLTLFIGSLVVVVPYVVFLTTARLQGLGTSLEDAASSLGAKPFQTFRLITFPQISRAVMSGTLFAFIITFNNFPVQYFLTPFGYNTLPLQIYTMVRSGYEPNINALATILITISIVIAFLVAGSKRGRSLLPGAAGN